MIFLLPLIFANTATLTVVGAKMVRDLFLPQTNFCLVGSLGSGKSTLIKINHIGHTQETVEKCKKVQTNNGSKKFNFTDTTGFSNESGVGFCRINKLKLKQNFVMVVDVRDNFSVKMFKQSLDIMRKQGFEQPIMALGNQKLRFQNKKQKEIVTIQSQKYINFLTFCFDNFLYTELCDFKNSSKRSRIYSVMEERVCIKKAITPKHYSVALMGQKQSGKSSIRRMLTGKIYNSEDPIIKQSFFRKKQNQIIEIDLYEGPPFDFKQGAAYWQYIENLVDKDMIIIVLDLACDIQLKYLNGIIEILDRDFRPNSNFNKIIIIGNKKGENTVNFNLLRQITELKFEAPVTHYIEMQCNDDSNRDKLLHYIHQRYLMFR